ncbi:MAG: penicillin-binding protein [Actinotalea sp.]|nr:penicillin-binding protein [Actinotalea sp.]
MAFPLGACSAPPPAPDDAAAALARGLATGDLTDVPLGETAGVDPSEQVATATAALEPLRPTVDVVDVTVAEDGATAGAVLRHHWDLDPTGEEDWTYDVPADLTLVEDAWQVRWSTALVAPDLRPGEVLATSWEPAERADVLGAGGVAIVEDRPVLRLGVDKTRVAAEQPDAARRVAEVLGLDPEAYADRVAAAGERAFVEALVVRAAEPGVDLEAFRAVDGALAVEDTLPLAPTRRFARAVLGTAGPATAELVEASDGALRPGDVTGLSGLQRQYDEQLRGTPGLTVSARTEDGTQRQLYARAPRPGAPLATTLDPAVQDAAETVLDPVPSPSAIVALRPSTGDVLALASGPGSDGYATATLGTYAPGSVFKVVSALALLRAGASTEATMDCPTTATVDGRAFRNYPGYPDAATGSITLVTAMAHSCNTAFIGSRDQAPPAALAAAAASLGLGTDAELGFPAFTGAVPADGSGTDHAAAMIGQGRVQASPLAMATVAASVARGGTVVPRLLADAPAAPDPGAEPLTEAEAEALRELLRAVVTEGGATFLADVPGEPVLAKTGTAQFGSGEGLANHAWMIGIQGDLAVAVLVEDGDYGSTTAGPLLEEFLRLVG